MKPYGFQSEARAEFLDAIRYYQAQQRGLGDRFLEAVGEAVQRIRERPLLYQEIEADIRQCLVEGFPYGLIYRLKNEQIEILAVMHLHRQPGYWKERASG